MKEKIFKWRECFPPDRLFNIHHVRQVDAKVKPRLAPAHGHDFAELFWISRGGCNIRVNGVNHVMGEGDLCLVRPLSDRHALNLPEGKLSFFNIAFPREILEDACRRYPDVKKIWRLDDRGPPVFHLAETERQWVDGAAGELMRAAQDRMLLDRFLLGLMCCIRITQTDPWHACPVWLRNAIREMHHPEYLIDGIPALLKLCRRSPAHVARVLKKNTGLTPSEVVNRIRLEHAVARLQNTSEDIQSIALDCGFNSLSYFYRVFQRSYGKTPRHYRRDHCVLPV